MMASSGAAGAAVTAAWMVVNGLVAEPSVTPVVFESSTKMLTDNSVRVSRGSRSKVTPQRGNRGRRLARAWLRKDRWYFSQDNNMMQAPLALRYCIKHASIFQFCLPAKVQMQANSPEPCCQNG